MFNSKRLVVARKRRRFSAKELAARAGVSPVTITRLETGQNEADADTVAKLSVALSFPREFFYLNDTAELNTDVVSFRSLKAMSAKERDAALTAGEIGVEVYGWVRDKFNLPELQIPNFDPLSSPEAAADALRQHWGLGSDPISSMLKLLEAKGVRLLGLEENTANVDAFSFWQDNEAYVFLNSFKTPERSVFDAAHELGHLVLHKHGSSCLASGKHSGGLDDNRIMELEANRFASAFLMPEQDIMMRVPALVTADIIIAMKSRWRVSAMALAYRLRNMTRPRLTEWQYRSICIELGKRGYRVSEPTGIEREYSAVWKQVLAALWTERSGIDQIASDLHLPVSEVNMLLSGIIPKSVRPHGEPVAPTLVLDSARS